MISVILDVFLPPLGSFFAHFSVSATPRNLLGRCVGIRFKPCTQSEICASCFRSSPKKEDQKVQGFAPPHEMV